MACLSRSDIEALTAPLIDAYRERFVPAHCLCWRVEPELLAQSMGLRVAYRRLSPDGSILGMTSSAEAWVSLPDDTGGEILWPLDGSSVLIEEALRRDPRLLGRLHFTLAHELGHQVVYRLDPVVPRFHCRSLAHTVTDWEEWQADAIGAALLMPRQAIEDAMFFFGLGEKMTVLSRKYSEFRFQNFCRMADALQVSRTALSYRMEQLGLLERNPQYDRRFP